MTEKENFYDNKIEIINQKKEFYKNHIEHFIIKLLMQFGKVFVADLFSDSDYNGNEKGSSLILIDVIHKILKDKNLFFKLRKKGIKFPQIVLLFNNKNNLELKKLKENLKKYKKINNLKIHIPETPYNFSEIIKEIENLKNIDTPKLFLFDVYTYSSNSLEKIKKIFNFNNSEVLFFTPILNTYKFKTSEKLHDNKRHKTIKFIENFSDRGLKDYKNIYDFNDSIISNLRNKLKTTYIKYVIFENESKKNSLFHITNNIAGSLVFTRCARKLGVYGIV